MRLDANLPSPVILPSTAKQPSSQETPIKKIVPQETSTPIQKPVEQNLIKQKTEALIKEDVIDISQKDTQIQFVMDNTYKTQVLRVVDSTTKDVLFQLPPKERLQYRQYLDNYIAGLKHTSE